MPVAAATAELVHRARRGEAPAFEELARRHLRAAYAVALAILQAPGDAEDVAQEAFVVALEKLDTCRDPERFSGWLLTIVRNRSRNALEARRVRGEGATARAAEQVAPADAERVGLRARLLQALSTLGTEQREVVLLHELEGFTHGEIAAALGISEVMSRQHLFTARRALRLELRDEEPEEGRHG